MFLPVQHKPDSSGNYVDAIVEVPNLITKELANELRAFALDSELSGWHRRGSKTPQYVRASFYTCLLCVYENAVYPILDRAWEQYEKSKNSNITFLEPYEIKSYVQGDQFSLHSDILISKNNDVERKINLVVQLSDEHEYEGGDLYIGSIKCPRTFGTGIFFPAKYLHCVTEVTRGERFSLIGHAWGPVSR